MQCMDMDGSGTGSNGGGLFLSISNGRGTYTHVVGRPVFQANDQWVGEEDLGRIRERKRPLWGTESGEYRSGVDNWGWDEWGAPCPR
jgi:hypothetical protein